MATPQYTQAKTAPRRHDMAARLRRAKGPLHLGLLHYSVARRVQQPVYAFAAWATIVWALDTYAYMPMVSSGGASSLIGVLAMIVGLLTSFRFSSSYDRWYEGRRTWASITSITRNMLRLLAFSLPSPATAANARQTQAMHELCRLVVAFSWATLHRLRDEPGVDHPELRALLPASLLEAYSDIPSLGRSVSTDNTGKVHHSTASESTRALAALNSGPNLRLKKPHQRLATLSAASTNLPLSLIRAIHAYLNEFHTTVTVSEGAPGHDTPALDDVTFGTCLSGLQSLTTDLTALERIRDTPIPLILNIHLQLLLFVYIAAVPLQLVRALGIWCVPATAIACAVFYGVDRAAEELSDPFGTEPNDLPIAKFCQQIEAEWLEVVGTAGSDGSDWLPDPVARKEE